MSSDWPLVCVEDVCELIVDCVNKTAPVVPEVTPYRMIRTTNVRNGRVDISECRYVDKETYEKWTRRAKLEVGDVILTREAPIGEVGFVTEAEGVFLGQRLMQYRADPTKLDSSFLLYSFLSPDLQHQFGSHEGSGSVVSHIRVGDCFKFKLRLPPFKVQQQIGSLLRNIDERIALLRETNATLEAIAQALFKSWFVDFDPVHANAGTQAQSLPPEIQALFPATFTDSLQGPIPDGWYAGQIGDVISIKGGYAFKSSDFQDSGSPVIKIKNIVGDGTVDCSDVQRVSESVASKAQRFILNSGDILMAMTGATIGKVGIYVSEANQTALVNQRVAKFENKNTDEKNTWLAFIAFSNAFMTDQVVNAASGSAQPNISSSGIESAKLVVPADKNVLKAFNSIVDPIFQSWIGNQKTVRLLSDLRDTLLPRLISGQLRLPEEAADLAEVG